jgi:hypothetical protein
LTDPHIAEGVDWVGEAVAVARYGKVAATATAFARAALCFTQAGEVDAARECSKLALDPERVVRVAGELTAADFAPTIN